MAARWGAGEETLTACNMDFFPMDTLTETAGLSTAENLEALQNCLDSSILSIFEDAPTIEAKGLDEESEATLLTALTEILDNVDDENLSPFDTLPDSDLLSGQKGREHSPLRRLLCLSRSPPEKDSLCRPLSTGKSLPRVQLDSLQRSDGEEEDDVSLSLSPTGYDSSCDNDLLDWKGTSLPFPVTLEQEGEDGVSVSLGDLVRHMHPYCMAICLDDNEEQMLPEGGILLEVVDQGENGEPILAIPDLDLPVSLPPKEQMLDAVDTFVDEAEDVASDSSEQIIVVDDDVKDVSPPVRVATSATSDRSSEVKDEKIRRTEEKSSSRRKKSKKKCKERCQSVPVEGRVLRSGTVTQATQETSRKSDKESIKREKKRRAPKVPPTSISPSINPKKPHSCPSDSQAEVTTTKPLVETNVQVAPCPSPKQDTALLKNIPETSDISCSPASLSLQQSNEAPELPVSADEKVLDSPAAVLTPESTETPAAAQTSTTPEPTAPICETPVQETTAVPEPKPKPLSLAEYRRLRQQKKPVPVETKETNSTKWPSLPELPKELPPIPCLPDPSPKDPRRPSHPSPKKQVEEVKPAWDPRGPAAPPTPEALLVPPAYMTASSSKVSAAAPVHRPQRAPEPSKPLVPEKPVLVSVKDSSTNQPLTPVASQTCGSPASIPTVASTDGRRGTIDERPQSQPATVERSKDLLKTTTESERPTAPTLPPPVVPLKTTVVQKVVPIAAVTTAHEPPKYSEVGTQPSPPPAAPIPDSQGLKEGPVVLEAKEKSTTSVTPRKAKDSTQELIEAFTSEIGIEAADLTSLLEQFEETQAKEVQGIPEVSGRAAAVGNSSLESAPEKSLVERVKANDVSSHAALTPPATPPHPMWKPLAPVALLGKSKAAEASRSSPSKVIQIEARPLPSTKHLVKPPPAVAPVDPSLACMDHDYCLPGKGAASPGEPGTRWNVKQQSFITIKPIKPATTATSRPSPTEKPPTPDSPVPKELAHSSVLETPDASPTRQDTESSVKAESPRRGAARRVYRRHAASRSPSPASSPKERPGGPSGKRRSRRSRSPASSSSESDFHSSRSRSRSRSPSKKRYRRRNSESSSSSSSRSSSRSSSPSASRSPPRRRRYSYSSSRSGSWSRSRSRSRSRSPDRREQWRRSGSFRSPNRPGYGLNAKPCTEQVKRRKEKAIEERRVVYVGRIRGTMTQKELGERFAVFGEIEECTLHFRDHGDNYGFVTFYDTKDAFTAIENGSRLRKPNELPFDLCFGGRRQFCRSNYADLDSSREYDPLPVKGKFHALDFDTLLKQAQQNQKR